jgi:hypothetical protein
MLSSFVSPHASVQRIGQLLAEPIKRLIGRRQPDGPSPPLNTLRNLRFNKLACLIVRHCPSLGASTRGAAPNAVWSCAFGNDPSRREWMIRRWRPDCTSAARGVPAKWRAATDMPPEVFAHIDGAVESELLRKPCERNARAKRCNNFLAKLSKLGVVHRASSAAPLSVFLGRVMGHLCGGRLHRATAARCRCGPFDRSV